MEARLYRGGALAERRLDPARVSDHLTEEGILIWLDATDPSDEELSVLQEEFDLHPLAVEDARHRGQRAKAEIYDRYIFLVMYGLVGGRPDEEALPSEIHAFVGSNYLITLRYPPSYDVSGMAARWERHSDLIEEGGGFLLYTLLDQVVDGYFDEIDRLESASETLEDEVFAEAPPEDVQERIFRLKKRVVQFRRRVAPLREALSILQGEPGIVTRRLEAYYRDVRDHLIRTLDFIDNLRELLTTALDAHLSKVSNRVNLVMRKVTSWGAIILVPTLIAGIYGMNFRHMPELDWRLGYAFALATMALAALALYRAFKRRGWL